METLQLTSSDRTTFLGSRFFVRLPRSTVDAILEDTRLSTYEEHDVLFHQGDSIDDVFFLLSGLIRLYRVGKDGREADVAVFSKGEMFAENAMCLGRATASAEAAEASIVARIDGAKLRQLAAADADVAQAFIEHLCHRGKMTKTCSRKIACSPLPSGLPAIYSVIVQTAPPQASRSACRSRRACLRGNLASPRKPCHAPFRRSASRESP